MQEATQAADIELVDVSQARSNGSQCSSSSAATQPTDSSEPSDAVRNFRVALVTMPFAFSIRPSIQLGLLKAIARRAGFPVDDYYLNMELAAQLGISFYEEIIHSLNAFRMPLTGEWLFSVAAFGEESSRADFFAAFPGEPVRLATTTGKDVAYLNDLRERVIPEFIEQCMERVDWGSYNAVGFTSTYQQNVASLALAKRIKQRFPNVAIIFGGSNLEGEMGPEYARSFPIIDYAVVGDADAVFPELLTRLAEGKETDDLLGVVTRRGDDIVFPGPAQPFRDLDSLPIPDYDSYYALAQRCGVDSYKDPGGDPVHDLEQRAIPFEASRGCWWGQKSHCTFCGFNRTSMVYRSKGAERTLAELDALNSKYGTGAFFASDSILDMKLVDGLFAPLASRSDRYEFFYLTKSNLTREQVRTLARGGLRVIFPGIESLTTHVLKLMRKGVTRLQNINTLKWSTYYGLTLCWNLLHGFPGEEPEDYVEELETVKLICHLGPPLTCWRIWVDRFSPNFRDRELFPIKWLRPNESYGYVYPSHVSPDKIAYFFEYESACDLVPEESFRETQDFIGRWRLDWNSGRRAALTYCRTESELVITDTRFDRNAPRTYTLPERDGDIYEAFGSAPRTPAQVCAALGTGSSGTEFDEDSITATCDDLCDAGLMIGEAGKYLSLAIPADPEF
jgi:ribosomal peptide maturation radical SAM protein 1